MAKKSYTTAKKTLPKAMLEEILVSLENIDGWGSVEIIIQDNKVTQITEKNIKKPKMLA